MADPFDFDGSDDAMMFEDLEPSTGSRTASTPAPACSKNARSGRSAANKRKDGSSSISSLMPPPAPKPPSKTRRLQVGRGGEAGPAPVSRDAYDFDPSVEAPPPPPISASGPPTRSRSERGRITSRQQQQSSSGQQRHPPKPGPAPPWVEGGSSLHRANSAPPEVPTFSRRPMSPELAVASNSRRDADAMRRPGNPNREVIDLNSYPLPEKEEAVATTELNEFSHDVSLMDTGEVGEEVAVVDEVMFALQGFAVTQKTPVRQRSAAALIELCSNRRKREILRQQGWARQLVGTLLGRREDEPLLAKATALVVCLLVGDGEGAALFQEYDQVSRLTHLLAAPSPTPPREGPGMGQAAKAFRTLQGACNACLKEGALGSVRDAPPEATDSATALTLAALELLLADIDPNNQAS
eukprot:CAMPEP_0118957400 /NCGR_PEP_ID=MMETSP1169-20130426/62086_1 /TAXON_ID=36882 /ORGANISM="Pyramimonas obovata, Strain CCMP722" /LENGTH=410 /DNA_ID=CAMNT_0006905479 /DNA_START=407 /DNA_END=1636 /DNA_ORIENTATION=+